MSLGLLNWSPPSPWQPKLLKYSKFVFSIWTLPFPQSHTYSLLLMTLIKVRSLNSPGRVPFHPTTFMSFPSLLTLKSEELPHSQTQILSSLSTATLMCNCLYLLAIFIKHCHLCPYFLERNGLELYPKTRNGPWLKDACARHLTATSTLVYSYVAKVSACPLAAGIIYCAWWDDLERVYMHAYKIIQIMSYCLIQQVV